MLDRAFDPDAVFTAAEVALVESIAHAVAIPQPADERTIRQSIGVLSATLPAQAKDRTAGELMLKTYMGALAGCDERALAYACRRCVDELDWMPTIHQIKERMASWISDEAVAIVRARAVLRAQRVSTDEGAQEPLDAERLDKVNRYLARHGIGTRFAADGSTYVVDEASSIYVPQEEAA